MRRATPTAGTCLECGCTDARACPGGCSWVDETRQLCSRCGPVSLKVFGSCQPKGSTRTFVTKRGKTVVTSDNPGLRGWERAVRTAAQTVTTRRRGYMFMGPVSVTIAFHLNRPKSVRTTRRLFPTTRPDLDKATRGILDPLTGVIFRDDAQVVEIHATKDYTNGAPFAWIHVRPMGVPLEWEES